MSSTELCEWLCAYLVAELRVPGGRIDPDEPMVNYGLDSLTAAAVLTAVERRVGFEVDPNALWDHPTVAAFTGFLAERTTSTV
ncbi:acyl carrier protein [Actinoplanes sp. CA-131856]